MDQFILESYFSQLEYYLELRDLSSNTKKSYRSFLKSYLEWLDSYRTARNLMLKAGILVGLNKEQASNRLTEIQSNCLMLVLY